MQRLEEFGVYILYLLIWLVVGFILSIAHELWQSEKPEMVNPAVLSALTIALWPLSLFFLVLAIGGHYSPLIASKIKSFRK